MPLKPGSSSRVVSANIAELHTGKTYSRTAEKFGKQKADKQAVAIALSTARGRAWGGSVNGLPPIAGMMASNQFPNVAGVSPASFGGAPFPAVGVAGPAAPSAPTNFQMPAAGPAQPAMPLAPASAFPGSPPAPQQPAMPMPAGSMLARGGVANLARAAGGPMGVGGFNMAKEAHMRPSFVEGSEMRKLTRGPILSAVSGRTDAHKAMVGQNSYVIPADIVSARGQGNTIAGANVLQRMFRLGPFGTSAPAIRPGHTMPRAMAPRPVSMLADGGEAHDEHGTRLVPVNLAGGEVVVPAANLMAVVHPDIKMAHAIMDKWIVHERKKLRKTLAKLPPPAKD